MEVKMRSRQEILDWIAEVELHKYDNVCMCGDYMDHPAWEAGHSPVSMYAYYLYQAQEELKEFDEANAT